tara:strand:+ start:154 stop:486 length:333 start_codon:yes stop_codon:yes gene_type:complete
MNDNKIIADFMGLPKVPCLIGTNEGIVTEGYNHPIVDVPITPRGMQYKYSWDWLMPVVEKIEELDCFSYMVEIRQGMCFIDGLGIEVQGDTKLIATYKAVLQFINQYNTK